MQKEGKYEERSGVDFGGFTAMTGYGLGQTSTGTIEVRFSIPPGQVTGAGGGNPT